MYDVAIIGAGLAGITCGQYLQQQGQQVVFLEKSRGLGGRIATRRLHNTIADHGARYLEIQGPQTQELITNLLTQGLLEPWAGESHIFTPRGMQPQSPQARYVTPLGMSAIAKALATGLDICLNHQVEQIQSTEQGWSIWSILGARINPSLSVEAKALVLAIPAPQALTLLSPLEGLNPDYLERLAEVDYDPCITVMAGYAPEFQEILHTRIPSWQAVTFLQDPILAWVGIDSTKRSPNPENQPVIVLHSTPIFAAQHLDSLDLNAVGQELCDRVAHHLFPELNSPLWFQVHRWRYAQPKTFLNTPYFPAPTPFPLICCGDWCQSGLTGGATGGFIEKALASGLAAAKYLSS